MLGLMGRKNRKCGAFNTYNNRKLPLERKKLSTDCVGPQEFEPVGVLILSLA